MDWDEFEREAKRQKDKLHKEWRHNQSIEEIFFALISSPIATISIIAVIILFLF